jgi:NhaA family Na+:H+ antiporter
VFAPFRNFAQTEASGGILLFLATLVALVWANSAWSNQYFDLWHTTMTVQIGDYGLSKTLNHWINDGLMAIFFFVVGLEIKREMLVGELASPRNALLPIAAAVGGATVPALIYLTLNAGGDNMRGWGVPMATDIAFALGVLAILGSRVPSGLKVFLAALAIVDDLLAVLVIAVFYTSNVEWNYLLAGLLVFVGLIVLNIMGIMRPLVYALLGVVLWLMFVKSGVHATIAGVLLALSIPARTRIDTNEFLGRARALLRDFERADVPGRSILTNPEHQAALQDLETATEQVQSPIQRLEHLLHPWVAFVIVPIFALANAGIRLDKGSGEALTGSIGLGIILGLILGKQIGITTVTALLVSRGWTTLPDGVTMRHIYGVSWLAGIGFTMSLFIADLAFLDDHRLAAAKAGILAASVIAGGVGYCLLRLLSSVAETTEVEPAQNVPT